MQALMIRRRRPRKTRASRSFRRDRVRRIRSAIRAGDYENALKLDIALDRLLLRLLHPDEASRKPLSIFQHS